MIANGTPAYFLWDNTGLLEERDAGGTVTERHTHGASPIKGIGTVVQSFRPNLSAALQRIYPVMDLRGSITKWHQSDGISVLASREYDAFGQIIPNSATGTWPNRFGYQGQSWLEILSGNSEQRLLLSPTRVYDPVIGRFLSRDPLNFGNPAYLRMGTFTLIHTFAKSHNSSLWRYVHFAKDSADREAFYFYHYVNHNPIESTDSTGLRPFPPTPPPLPDCVIQFSGALTLTPAELNQLVDKLIENFRSDNANIRDKSYQYLVCLMFGFENFLAHLGSEGLKISPAIEEKFYNMIRDIKARQRLADLRYSDCIEQRLRMKNLPTPEGYDR